MNSEDKRKETITINLKETLDLKNKESLANKYFQEGKFDEAYEIYKEISNSDPKNANSINQIARILLQKSKYKEALEYFKKTLSLKPNNPIICFNISNLLLQLNQINSAEKYLDKGLMLNPDHHFGLFIKGKIHFKKKEFEFAIKELSNSFEQNEHNYQTLKWIAESYHSLEKRKEAKLFFEKYISKEEKDDEVLNTLGVFEFEEKNYERALDFFEKSIQSSSTNKQAIQNKSLSLIRLKKFEESLKNLMKLLVLNQDEALTKALFIECVINISLETFIKFSNDESFKHIFLKIFNNEEFDDRKLQPYAIIILQELGFYKNAKEFINDFDKSSYIYNLFIALLKKDFVKDLATEKNIREIKKYLLEKRISKESNLILKGKSELLFLFTKQSFMSEYISDDILKNSISKKCILLEKEIIKSISSKNFSQEDLFLLASYVPIEKISYKIKDYIIKNNEGTNFLNEFVTLNIFNAYEEEEISKEIKKIDTIKDKVSKKVKNQYENNPYPRWGLLENINTLNFDEFLKNEISYKISDKFIKKPDLLIAGCGTGRHPILAGKQYFTKNIDAIDISLSSLSYAKRKAIENKIDINFFECDILNVSQLEKEFDVIESIGVIHHMEDPKRGLKKLVNVLKRNGFIKIGLYSSIARKDINLLRHKIRNENKNLSPENIKNFRNNLIEEENEIIYSLRNFSDFFSLSEFRDLLFHVQEHQYTIDDLILLMEENSLKFLGFSIRQSIQEEFISKYGYDLRNLDKWKNFEIKYPSTFIEMYNFWCQKI